MLRGAPLSIVAARPEGIFSMNPCANCGATPRPSDKFCNTCGTPVVAAAPAGYPPAAGGWGAAPPAARCQMGHDVPPGQNYCPQGHPIALEQVQFAPNPPQYGGAAPPTPSYGGTPGGSASGSGAKYAQAGAGPSAQQAPPYPGYANPPQYPPQPAGYAPPPAAAPAYAPPQGYAPPAPAGYSPPAATSEPKPAPAPPLPNSLAGFLLSYEGNPLGDFWALNGGRYTLGRANSGETVDISLADATISSRHAVLEVDALTCKVAVEDTGSTNGTFVNDEHVGFNGRRDLVDGDRLRLGGYTTIVKVIARG